MTSLQFFLNQPLQQWLAEKKRDEDRNAKILENEKSFLDEIKNIFHSF